jgi:hypothetical protein
MKGKPTMINEDSEDDIISEREQDEDAMMFGKSPE